MFFFRFCFSSVLGFLDNVVPSVLLLIYLNIDGQLSFQFEEKKERIAAFTLSL